MLPVVLNSRAITPEIRREVGAIMRGLSPAQVDALAAMTPEQARRFLNLPAPVSLDDLGWINFVIQAALAVAAAKKAKDKKAKLKKQAAAAEAQAKREADAQEAAARKAEQEAKALEEQNRKAATMQAAGGSTVKWGVAAGLVVAGVGIVYYLTRRK